jgi:hypothetical protein
MEYTEEMQSYLDLDWFLIDINKKVAHCASGGGKLPKSVAISKEEQEEMASFIRTLPEVSENIIINPNLNSYLTFNTAQDKERYLQDFIFMAKRGLYSYDKTIINNPQDFKYHLVAKPTMLLVSSNFPPNIIRILGKTLFEGDLNEAEIIISTEIK